MLLGWCEVGSAVMERGLFVGGGVFYGLFAMKTSIKYVFGIRVII